MYKIYGPYVPSNLTFDSGSCNIAALQPLRGLYFCSPICYNQCARLRHCVELSFFAPGYHISMHPIRQITHLLYSCNAGKLC